MEKEFSEKLSQREIQPGNAAWDRLDAMLTVAEEKKSKRSFNWLYLAASFAGLLLVGTIFLRQQTTNKGAVSNDQVVEQSDVVKGQTNTNSDTVISNQPQEQVAGNEGQTKTSGTNDNKKTIKNTTVNASQNYKQQIADISTIKSKTSVDKAQQLQSSNQDLISQNPELNPNPVRQSNATTDELLAVAQAKSGAATSNAGVKVNAKSLLSQVDSHSPEQLSLKQKFIRTVGKNYQTVKVAVANRNLEENH
jgi:hypothetical protein